jgi:hypothetical protein
VIARRSPLAYRDHVIAFFLAAAVAAPGLDTTSLEALRAIDLRLATIGHRLVTANAPLCRDQARATGLILHAITQYDADTQAAARDTFGFATPIGVEAVVPGSAAAAAGVMANDGVTAIGDQTLAASATPPSAADRDAAIGVLEAATTPVRLTIVRPGTRRNVSVASPMGCRARFEVLLGPQMTAQSDGRVVQIGVRFFERYRDEDVAVIVAHELAHIVLRHRVRLEAAGVKGGLLGEIGRNAALGQRAELEADTLGVTLLHNAGYDSASAARFWRDHGGDIDGGLFRSRTHPATKRRIASIEAAAAAIPAGTGPYVPPVLAERDAPLK